MLYSAPLVMTAGIYRVNGDVWLEGTSMSDNRGGGPSNLLSKDQYGSGIFRVLQLLVDSEPLL